VRVLVVAATAAEIAPVVDRLEPAASRRKQERRIASYRHGRRGIDILVTGVGMVATAAWCSRALTASRYDLALNVGLCGSFDPAIVVGAAVHVVSDRIAELGAEDDEAFLTVHKLQLLDENDFPYSNGRLVNDDPPANPALSRLPAVDAITVNTVHGNARSIAAVVERFGAQVESMEGAAFMYACLLHGIPFAQVRTVSNKIERRDRAAWKVEEACRTLAATTLAILDCQ
jgi:futalosine hydrolase